MSAIPDDGEDPAARRLEEVNVELMELTRQIPLIEDGVRRQLMQRFEADPKYARAKGTPAYNDLTAAEVKFEMADQVNRRDVLRERQKQLQAEQRVRLGRSLRAEAQERVARWRESPVEDHNAFLRTYFSALKFGGDHGGEYLVPVLRDGETEWPAIPLRIPRWGNTGQVRRHLPTAPEYVKSIYRAVGVLGHDLAGAGHLLAVGRVEQVVQMPGVAGAHGTCQGQKHRGCDLRDGQREPPAEGCGGSYSCRKFSNVTCVLPLFPGRGFCSE